MDEENVNNEKKINNKESFEINKECVENKNSSSENDNCKIIVYLLILAIL